MSADTMLSNLGISPYTGQATSPEGQFILEQTQGRTIEQFQAATGYQSPQTLYVDLRASQMPAGGYVTQSGPTWSPPSLPSIPGLPSTTGGKALLLAVAGLALVLVLRRR